jgi:hypothetical protein
MYYKQLKDFFRQREQKAFWIFNYANIAGLFGGLFVARFLAEQMPWLPGPLLIPLVMFGGLSLTWQRQGRETYKTWWLWARYVFRRLFASSSLVLHSAEHYKIEHTALRPFSIAGRLAFSGEDASRAYGRSMAGVSTSRIAKGGSSNGHHSGGTLPLSAQAKPSLDFSDIEEG